MHFHSDELRLLAQLGLMAATRRKDSAATAIFAAIEVARPQSSITFVGPAMNHLCAGRLIEAIRCLERGLEVVGIPDRPELYSLLALAYHFEARPSQCERALAQAGDIPLALAVRRQTAGALQIAAPAP